MKTSHKTASAVYFGHTECKSLQKIEAAFIKHALTNILHPRVFFFYACGYHHHFPDFLTSNNAVKLPLQGSHLCLLALALTTIV